MPNQNSNQPFRAFIERFLCTALILFASHAMLNAQPFTKITTGQIATDLRDASGASWIDYDGDGDLDLFTSNRAVANYLYRNAGNGSFPRVNAGSLTTINSIGNSWADYDNDGDLDVFTVGFSSVLHRNQGNGTFANVTTAALGLASANLAGWGCAWADFDNDRHVDLVIAHAAGSLGTSLPNFLFRNKGDGTFERITNSPVVTGLAPYTVPTWSDFDQDGDQDLFIGSGPANGTRARDYLYRNQLKQTGAATFERITESPLGTDLADGQVWNWIDYDNDGDLDAYLTNYIGNVAAGLRNFFYRNDGGTYTSITNGAIATDAGLSLGQVWGDFDNDGDLDVFVAEDNNNGAANKFYQNNGNGTFTRILTAPFTTDIAPSWGATGGDFDNDGDLDLFIPNVFRPAIQAPPHFYRNDLSNNNHWVKLKLVGTSSNRDGIGAKIRAKAMINGSAYWQLREASSQNTFCGQNSPEIHCGFGNAATIDSLRIEWPLGQVDVYTGVQTNTVYQAVEGAGLNPLSTGIKDESPAMPLGFTLEQNYPNPFNPTTRIAFILPVASRVTLTVFEVNGRIVAELLRERQKAPGQHEVSFTAQNLASGVYSYKLEVRPNNGSMPAFVETKSMTYLK
ncbi:MAG: hypothetical protein ALAOOOJD_01321 [bacterium]|nr:hypothetical protein [bacterium]